MISLENKFLQLQIRPLGAKITSFKYKASRNPIEILYTPKDDFKNLLPQEGDIFDERFAWGADICAPSVAACEVQIDDYLLKVEDHGNFWTKEFQIKDSFGDSALLSASTDAFRIDIKFDLVKSKLVRSYEVTNLTKYKLPFTFADHLLLLINRESEPDNYLDFGNIDQFDLEYSYNENLGKKGDEVPWPIVRRKPFADKLFAKLNEGSKVEYRNRGLEIDFSSDALDYLGYWHTEGGWKDEHNLGLELTNTNFDNLKEGVERDSVWWIGAGSSKKFAVNMDISKV